MTFPAVGSSGGSGGGRGWRKRAGPDVFEKGWGCGSLIFYPILVAGSLAWGVCMLVCVKVGVRLRGIRLHPHCAHAHTNTHACTAHSQVIKGMDLGVASMCEGERAELKIRYCERERESARDFIRRMLRTHARTHARARTHTHRDRY